jgi:hypothetical protein
MRKAQLPARQAAAFHRQADGVLRKRLAKLQLPNTFFKKSSAIYQIIILVCQLSLIEQP